MSVNKARRSRSEVLSQPILNKSLSFLPVHESAPVLDSVPVNVLSDFAPAQKSTQKPFHQIPTQSTELSLKSSQLFITSSPLL